MSSEANQDPLLLSSHDANKTKVTFWTPYNSPLTIVIHCSTNSSLALAVVIVPVIEKTPDKWGKQQGHITPHNN